MLRGLHGAAGLAMLGTALAIAIVTCGGKVVVDQGDGSGGAGGGGNQGGTGNRQSASSTMSAPDGQGPAPVGPGPGPEGPGPTTSTGPGECQTCAEFITNGDPSAQLCAGSDQLYDKLVACLCVFCGGGPCMGFCQAMGVPGEQCQECLQTSATMGCMNEFNACASDI